MHLRGQKIEYRHLYSCPRQNRPKVLIITPQRDENYLFPLLQAAFFRQPVSLPAEKGDGGLYRLKRL